jgi:hypothetical protein
VSILLASHRPENIPLLESEMARREAVFLEEAVSADFSDMLEGRVSIDTYLSARDEEYPEFSRRFCTLLQKLHRNGVSLFQVDPFVDTLLAVHDFFAGGGTPADLPAGTDRLRVYEAERRATGALLAFYKASLSAGFQETVTAVQRFARTDAERFRLRDEMRANAVAERASGYHSSCVEAGYMHLWLWRRLKRRLTGIARVRPVHLLREQHATAGVRRRNLGPGDVLTLGYLFHPKASGPRMALLAARSLIYVKLLEKEEQVPGTEPFPHLVDEMKTGDIVDRLSYEDCRRLYPLIRRAKTPQAREIVRRYLAVQGASVDQPTR